MDKGKKQEMREGGERAKKRQERIRIHSLLILGIVHVISPREHDNARSYEAAHIVDVPYVED